MSGVGDYEGADAWMAAHDFPKSKEVGASEYSAIHDVVRESLAWGPEPGTEAEFVDAILAEFEGWARELRGRIQKREES